MSTQIENARAMARIAENDILSRLREAEERDDDDGTTLRAPFSA